MKASLFYVLPVIAVLGACSPKPASESAADMAVMGGTAEMQSQPEKAGPSAAPDISVPQLAYDYDYGFTAGVKGIETLLASDQARCEQAGPAQCQIISLRADASPDSEYAHKTLELRVAPAWLKTWQAGLAGKLEKAGGKVVTQNVTSEDLSLRIVDTEAHIKNKMALRDRLQQIIRTGSGKISELIEAETQLSQVQQEIDASQSALAVMQKRVATIHLTLTYESRAVAASRGAASPVTDALKGVFGNIMQVLAFLITLISFLLPLALVGWLGWLGYRKWRSTHKPKTVAEAKDADAKD